jgi:carbamoyltransferase
MLMVSPTKEDKQNLIPAVVHVDGTGRVQTVSRDDNSRIYSLIESFRQLTGIPVILNTSFNIAGEPIVETPADAIRCFLGTQIDALVIGSYLIKKR